MQVRETSMQTLARPAARRSQLAVETEATTARRSLVGALRSLVVHVDAGPHTEARLRIARSLAQRHGAAVTAVYATTPAAARIPMTMESAAIAPLYTLLADMDRARRDDAMARFAAVRAAPGALLSWEEASGFAPFLGFARRALLADLLVLGQHDPGAQDVGVPADFVESVLIQSGTPALVLPYVAVQPTIGTCALVAWKETAASARALRAALPVLQFASEVHLVSWSDGDDDGADPNPAAAFLSRHGIPSRVRRSPAKSDEVGERLLSMAAEVSADLVVMGCHGHSRARELVLGGVTRTVLRSMTLPVLMAH
jgi:nucleotide-binding universal stress UspA family protein